MKRVKYLKMRQQAYDFVGVIGTEAETQKSFKTAALAAVYARGCEMLDALDQLGYGLEYLDAETNNVLPPKRRISK